MKSKILSFNVFILFSLSLAGDLVARGGGGHGGGGHFGGGHSGGGSHMYRSSGSRAKSGSRSKSGSFRKSGSRSKSGSHGKSGHAKPGKGGRGGGGRGGHGRHGHHGNHNWHHYHHGGYWYGGWGWGWWPYGFWYGPAWGWWYPALAFSIVLSDSDRVVYVENDKEEEPLYFATYRQIWINDKDYYLTRVSRIREIETKDSLKVEFPEDYDDLQVIASRNEDELAEFIKQDDSGNIKVLNEDDIQNVRRASALNIKVSELDDKDKQILAKRYQERNKNKENFDREMSKNKS